MHQNIDGYYLSLPMICDEPMVFPFALFPLQGNAIFLLYSIFAWMICKLLQKWSYIPPLEKTITRNTRLPLIRKFG